jgi:hypothetical protein
MSPRRGRTAHSISFFLNISQMQQCVFAVDNIAEAYCQHRANETVLQRETQTNYSSWWSWM